MAVGEAKCSVLLHVFFALLDAERRAGHGEHALVRLVPADKSTRMTEDTASALATLRGLLKETQLTRDTSNLRELVVTDAAPRLGERAAVLKAVGALGDTLDAPLGVGVGRVLGVEDVEDGVGVLVEGGLDGEQVVLPGCRLQVSFCLLVGPSPPHLPA